MSHDLSLNQQKTHMPVQATIIEVAIFPSFNIDTKFDRNCVFTFEGEHDFWFLHLMTFKAHFFGLELFSHCGWRNFYDWGYFLQMRLIFLHLWLIFTQRKIFTFVVSSTLTLNVENSLSMVYWLLRIIPLGRFVKLIEVFVVALSITLWG